MRSLSMEAVPRSQGCKTSRGVAGIERLDSDSSCLGTCQLRFAAATRAVCKPSALLTCICACVCPLGSRVYHSTANPEGSLSESGRAVEHGRGRAGFGASVPCQVRAGQAWPRAELWGWLAAGLQSLITGALTLLPLATVASAQVSRRFWKTGGSGARGWAPARDGQGPKKWQRASAVAA